jgi:predicted RNA binding protein YcfA (HicA-like mRNA interferase family)
MPMKVRDLLKRLADDGWVEVRASGSHRQFAHPTKAGKVTIAFHSSNQDIPTGTLRSIFRQAGWVK